MSAQNARAMSALEAARDRFLALHEGFAASRVGEPAWLARLRADALGAFREQGLPHTRLEEWRHTNVTPLARVPFALASSPARPVARDDLEHHAFPVFACSVYVFVNGRFAPELSAAQRLNCGTTVESLADALRGDPERLASALGRAVDLKQHAFAALATAFLDDGACVRVPRGAGTEQPIHLVFVSTPGAEGQPLLSHPRVLVEAAASSRLTLIQDHVAVGTSPGFSNCVTEVDVGPDAQVDLVLVQREPDYRFHVSNLAVAQDRDSRFAAHTLCFGGAIVRNDAGVRLLGEGAECRLDGLFVAGGRQLVDNHTSVDHAVPRCTSREIYKGIVGGQARGVFRGRILVRPDAQKTSAQQSNANLLLGVGAEVDTKPQLEILADDVKCSHGSSVGQLDPDAFFYLRSRGLSEDVARDLLTRGFAQEILRALPQPALSDALDDVLQQRLRLAHAGGLA
jgi:Fe-S cluster assembly protein SufD